MEAFKLIWAAFSFFCSWIWCWYIINRILLHWSPFAMTINKELWWLVVHVAGPVVMASYFINGLDKWDYFFFPIILWMWWDIWKNDDHDDRWKKRRKKATSKVKVVAGKLVVVPRPQPA